MTMLGQCEENRRVAFLGALEHPGNQQVSQPEEGHPLLPTFFKAPHAHSHPTPRALLLWAKDGTFEGNTPMVFPGLQA